MKTYITKSQYQTKALAKQLTLKIKNNIIILSGELGVGKTTFVQGFARGLKIKDKILSPTFVLIRQHKIPKSDKTLYHIDLYRLDDVSIESLGLQEIFNNPDNLVLIEWGEKIEKNLSKVLKIKIEKTSSNTRLITIS